MAFGLNNTQSKNLKIFIIINLRKYKDKKCLLLKGSYVNCSDFYDTQVKATLCNFATLK